jgi:hypothetical protein
MRIEIVYSIFRLPPGSPPERRAAPVAPPFLSIVLTGRNDDYGRDFKERFLRTVRFNARELAARGIDHEFVFVEWAPLPNRPLLLDLACDAISGVATLLTGYIVDPQYQPALSQNPRLQYLEFIAKNVGIRRAAGAFVLVTNCDVFLGREVLGVLERRALGNGVVYRAPRHDLKMALDQSHLDFAAFENATNLERQPPVLKPPLYAGGSGDFLLLDRAAYHALGGFNEVYRVARVGIDHNFLVKALSAGYEIRDIGGPVYHVNHLGTFRLTRSQYAGREHEAPYGNVQWHSRQIIYSNPSTWGLSNAPETKRGPWAFLEFSWDAVPPLVDLRGVVTPVARRDPVAEGQS